MKRIISVISLLFVGVVFYSNSTKSVISTSLKPAVAIYPDFIGVNANLTSIDQPWNSEKLMQVTQKMAIGNLRYPGGTIGNTWDWSLGWIDQKVAPDDLIKWVVSEGINTSDKRYTIDNYAKGIQQIGSSGVLMLNMLTKDVQHSIDGLKRLQAQGVEIKYVELGNEIYFNLPLEMRVFPTPQSLGETSKVWIDALKQEFPDAKYAVVGTTIRRRPRHDDWNQHVLQHATNADAITLHMYTPFSLFGNKEIANFSAGEEGLESRSEDMSIAEQQKLEIEYLNKPNYFANLLTNVKNKSLDIEKMAVPNHIDIWVTEFNFRGDNSAIRGSWANSLALAAFYDQFLASEKVKLSNIHNLIGNTFELIHGDKPLQHILDKDIYRKPWSVGAGGLITHYFGTVMNGQSRSQKILFENVPLMTDVSGQAYDGISGYVFSGGEVKRGIVINYTDQHHSVELPISSKQQVAYRQVSAPLAHYVMDEDLMAVSSGSTMDKLELAPYSVTTFTFD